MGKVKTSAQLLHVKNYGELVRELSKQPGTIRVTVNNSTVKIEGENGYVPVHNHPTKQPKRGTLRGILEMAVKAGILVSGFAGLYYVAQSIWALVQRML